MMDRLAFDPGDVRGVYALRVRYLGQTDALPPRYSVSWVGWASGETARRSIPAGTLDRRVIACRAASVFLDWINDPKSPVAPYRVKLAAVALGELPGDSFVVTVTTETEDS